MGDVMVTVLLLATLLVTLTIAAVLVIIMEGKNIKLVRLSLNTVHLLAIASSVSLIVELLFKS